MNTAFSLKDKYTLKMCVYVYACFFNHISNRKVLYCCYGPEVDDLNKTYKKYFKIIK